MSFDPETTRIVRSWLDQGVTELPDRVLDAVLDQVPATPQSRATWWPARRLSTMSTTLKFGLAAVVVAVAALIGINYLGAPTSVGGPGPDVPSSPASVPTPEPTPTPQPTPESNLEAGETFTLSLPQYPVVLTATIPAAVTASKAVRCLQGWRQRRSRAIIRTAFRSGGISANRCELVSRKAVG